MNQGLLEINWIPISEASLISRSYPKGPHTYNGLIQAGRKGGFIQKSSDGFHWEFEKNMLIRYCEISNRPTLRDLAEKLGTSISSINYIILKNQIPHKTEMNRKFLEEKDAQRVIEIYKTGGR